MNDITLKENDQSSMLVPYTYYESNIPNDFTFVPLHWHSEFEISYILNGTARFEYSGNSFLANMGDIVIIPPDMPHLILQENDFSVEYKTIVFSKAMLSVSSGSRADIEFLQSLIEEKIKLPFCIAKDNHLYSKFEEAVKSIMLCAKKDSAQYDLLLKSEMLKFAYLLIESDTIRHTNAKKAKHSKEIQKALQYINHNTSENITIEQLAKSANLSKSHFMSKFKQETGQSAITYINNVRIKQACAYLISSEKSISEIGFECGFRNISNFNRHFLAFAGCSPSEYRKTVKKHLTV